MEIKNGIIKDGIIHEAMEGSCLSCDMCKHCATNPHKPCKVFGEGVRFVSQREYMQLYMCLSEDIIKLPQYDAKKDEFSGEFVFKDGAGFTEYIIPRDIQDRLIISNGPGKGFTVIITIKVNKLNKEIRDDILYHFVNNKVVILIKDDSFPLSKYKYAVDNLCYCRPSAYYDLKAQIVIETLVSRRFLNKGIVTNLKIKKTMK